MEVTSRLITHGKFLWGGAGLGAAISAMEGTTGRNVVWATSQYLSYARPGEVLDIDVTVAVHGYQMTQARAVCHVGNREILTVNAHWRQSFDRAPVERCSSALPGEA
jgi:acyl-CoA thioesterase